MVTTAIPGETRVLLENITWQTFKTMLAEMGSERANKISYRQGNIEVMTPLKPHESSNRLIEVFVGVLCEELGLEVNRVGSLTLTRDDLEYGAEPDSSYYIQNELLVREKENIDLAFDPPPDLVLEVEYSRPKIDKFKLYAAMGIPEFWRYNGTTLRVYILANGQYSETQTSPTFAVIPIKEIPRFIEESKKIGQIAVTRAFRTWVKLKASE
ncbi:MAG: Uma2 family endonuclease [Dolichospermum sp.]|jgi:Uma2 family endonuclease|uniref:Uma2 family endonuclease n=1 Tax=Dolichospermum TaxID=748770 RepID=UPI0003FCA845|nr:MULTISPECIES: Uma2 family endonuclease [Dolichospermum]MCW9681751.1 Uma2 family endonuclease [Dolichospermum planctonicum UHCC 0167]MDB9474459.1 Uma2 family endonuclease [Dolichospermum circinale CS-537/11]MDB9478440.1 Uma2 family endonuclease [Dolichospermum circinale CS-537/03]